MEYLNAVTSLSLTWKFIANSFTAYYINIWVTDFGNFQHTKTLQSFLYTTKQITIYTCMQKRKQLVCLPSVQ